MRTLLLYFLMAPFVLAAEFAIYPVVTEPIDEIIAHPLAIHVGPIPLLTEKEILSYSSDHRIAITEEAFQRIKQYGWGYRKPFTVCVDKKVIYKGYVWSDLCSVSCDKIVMLPRELSSGKYEIAINAGYPTSSFFKGEDYRSEASIIKELSASGKYRNK